MRAWFNGLVLYMTYLTFVTSAVNPACQCVVYQSYGRSHGGFNSPNYPNYYSRNEDCILYTFIGDLDEIVEIVFFTFDLKPPREHGKCDDFLRLFQNVDRPAVNEYTEYDDELCGDITHMKQKTFYSRGRSMILEFHSDNSKVNHTGFKGEFRFLNQADYKTDGRLEHGTPCTYQIQSNNNGTSGKFFSPDYPQNYPPYSHCQYIFYGQQGERVKVEFKNIQIHNDELRSYKNSCRESPDKLIIHDGRDDRAGVLDQYCDIWNSVEVTSTGPYMFIQFKSDGRHQMKGFAATYRFEKQINPSPSSTDSSRPQQEQERCNRNIMSENGTISSPNFPRPYQANLICQYEFQGTGTERIQLTFITMSLQYTQGDPKHPHDCSGQDTLSVFITLNGTEQKLGAYCGQQKIPHLMSSEPKMRVVFQSTTSGVTRNAEDTSGFQFKYTFRKDFGITSGEQDARGLCTFNYYSTKVPSGQITSPNYPGLYPRNTECHYLFFGRPAEKVYINFPEFDVDGIPPRCDKNTKSDYVSFSNFRGSEDRKMSRFCGAMRTNSANVSSDGGFFRVTFKSNNVYDSRGFHGSYEFINTQSHTTTYAPTSSATSMTYKNCQLTYLAMFLLAAATVL